MTFLTSKRVQNAPAESLARVAIEFANANLALDLNAALTAAGVTTATTPAKAKTVNTLTYLSNGAFKSKGATDNFFVLGTAGQSPTVVPVASFQKYLLCIDPTGAAPAVFEATASPIAAANVTWPGPGWASLGGIGVWGPLLYILNQGYTIVATLLIATDATHTFTPGTTSVATGSGITATFADGIDQSILPLVSNALANVMGLTG
jgi:hypothetical protein